MSATKPRRTLATLGVLAIAVPAAALAGCGSDTEDQVNDAIDNAQEQIDQAADDAREQADELQEDIQRELDEATDDDGDDSTSTTEDSTSTTEDSDSTTEDSTTEDSTEDSGGYGYP